MKEIIGQLKSYVPEEPLESVQARLGIDKLVRLSANENPYGTSQKVREAVLDYVANNDANYYPDGYAASLRQALSEHWDIPGDQFVIGVGLDEVISLVSRTFLCPGDNILVSTAAFSEYASSGLVEGAEVTAVPCQPETGHYDFPALLAAVNDKTRLVWFCNPNNPTGTYETVEDLRNFISQVPKNTIVIIDEAYIDFVTDVPVPTAMELLKEFDNIAMMRTFSKAYGLANYRVGYMIMCQELTKYVQTIRLPYNLNSVSQVAAEAAFKDEVFLKDTIEKNRVQRDKWETVLTDLGVKFFHSQANFIYMQIDEAIAEEWLKVGYQVRKGLQPGWLRIGIGNAEDCDKMQTVLRQFLGN